jgi:hypothetical protein
MNCNPATVGNLWRTVLRRIDKAPIVALARHEGIAGTSLPTFQFQLFTKSPVPLSDVEREDLVSRFAAQLQHVRRYWQREIVGHSAVGQTTQAVDSGALDALTLTSASL